MGFEPISAPIPRGCSARLSYDGEMERVAGFEPVSLVDGNHVFYLVNFTRMRKGCPSELWGWLYVS